MKAIYKTHHSKNLPCKVMVSYDTMNLIEDYLECIPLCDEHKGVVWEAESPYKYPDTMYMYCSKCMKVKKKWESGVWKVYSQLCKKFYP